MRKEVQGEQPEKFFSYVSLNVLAEGWVEPHDIAFSALSSSQGLLVFNKLHLAGIAALE